MIDMEFITCKICSCLCFLMCSKHPYIFWFNMISFIPIYITRNVFGQHIALKLRKNNKMNRKMIKHSDSIQILAYIFCNLWYSYFFILKSLQIQANEPWSPYKRLDWKCPNIVNWTQIPKFLWQDIVIKKIW